MRGWPGSGRSGAGTLHGGRRLARRPGSAAAPGSEVPVLDEVAARGHVAPGSLAGVGAVVEGPEAVAVAAGLQPGPGAVLLGVADDQQEAGQPAREPVAGAGVKLDAARR